MSRVFVAGGGTGGHVVPSLAFAAALARARPDLGCEFVGTARGLEARLVPAAGWTLHQVETLPLARRPIPATLRLPLVLARATRRVARLLRDRDAAAVVVFGGYVAVPLALAARRTRTPLVVHEQNAVPGVANRLAARWAIAVAVTVPGSEGRFPHPDRVVLTGNPVRPGLAGTDPAALRPEALAAFGLEPQRRTLLVFGGSQGARRINDALVATAPRWPEPERLQVVHAAGRGGVEAARAAWRASGAAERGLLVRCEPFLERMDLAYAAADVTVCRAGASTIAELTVLGMASVLVPYPHATANHQTVNARALVDAGAATMVPDAALDADALVRAAEPLLRDDALRARMAATARRFARPDAAARLADVVLAAAGVAGEDGGAAATAPRHSDEGTPT